MNNTMSRILYLYLFICINSMGVYSQSMPDSVRAILDVKFPQWKITSYSIPSECYAREYVKLDPKARIFYICNLNMDKIPDYAMRIFTGQGRTLMEYFVVILSENSSYKLFILDSCTAARGAGERYLYLLKPGDKTNIFDDPFWEVISEFGKLSKGQRATFISFPIDALKIKPICGGKFKEVEIDTYVYIKNRFYNFSSAD